MRDKNFGLPQPWHGFDSRLYWPKTSCILQKNTLKLFVSGPPVVMISRRHGFVWQRDPGGIQTVPVTSGWSGLISYNERRLCRIRAQLLCRLLPVRFRDRCGSTDSACSHVGEPQVVVMQTYEGGIGAEPGAEAHGGYTFCGLAALVLIDRADALDLPKLLHFAVKCQVAPRQCSHSRHLAGVWSSHNLYALFHEEKWE